MGWSEESFISLRAKLDKDQRKLGGNAYKYAKLRRQLSDLEQRAMYISTRTRFKSFEDNLYVDNLSQRLNRLVLPSRPYGMVGLPQGSPLSPLLSILLLDRALSTILRSYPEVHALFYADDGMFYSNSETILRFIETLQSKLNPFGITVHPEKSRWVKRHNKWECGLKFLGYYYMAPFKQ